MQNQPNRRPSPDKKSQYPEQNNALPQGTPTAGQPSMPYFYPTVPGGYPLAYPFGWNNYLSHPVNPMNQMNPMLGMYYHNQQPVAHPQPQPRPSPAVPTETPESKPQPVKAKESATSVSTASATSQKRTAAFNNLDDPEELERWKAERRKRFPTRSNLANPETEPTKQPEPPKVKEGQEGVAAIDTTNGGESEEGELSSEDGQQDNSGFDAPASPKTKRNCKYFAAGKCRNGDSCQFLHVKTVPSTAVTTGQTVFETLRMKQEREDLLQFYNCLKIIVNSPSFRKQQQ